MNSVKKAIQFVRLGARKITATPVVQAKDPYTPAPKNPLKEIQKKFQVDDGVPVFLKGGAGDKILYQITLVSLAVGLVMSLSVLVQLALPKKN